ncbi:MAG: hypothetical protein MR960_05145 [Prevotella sp.]|nr:hypothetical protein [Prevotella sp.]
MPTYAIAPETGPHTCVASNVEDHGWCALIIGAPTSCTENVNNVFFINLTVSTTSTVATVTAK